MNKDYQNNFILTWNHGLKCVCVCVCVCILQERDTLLMQFQGLKGQMSRLHSTEHQRLVKLTTLCDLAVKDLNAKRAKVQRSILTKHRASTSMYSLTFRVRVTTPRSMGEMERRTQQARRFYR